MWRERPFDEVPSPPSSPPSVWDKGTHFPALLPLQCIHGVGGLQ